MIRQLRIYTINKGKMDEFVKGWLAGVYPLHLEHGYKIERAGVIPERNEFVWEVSYNGDEDWDAKQAAYYGFSRARVVGSRPSPIHCQDRAVVRKFGAARRLGRR